MTRLSMQVIEPAAHGAPDAPSRRGDDDEGGLQPADIAAEYQEEHEHPDGLTLRRWRSSWWQWDGQRYQEVTDERITTEIFRRLIDRRARKKAKKSFVADAVACLKIDTLVDDDINAPAWLSSSPPTQTRQHVALANGILDINQALVDDNPIRTHTPAFLSTVALPYGFDPAAECPRWTRTLEWILPEVDKRRALQQYVGYCLWAGHVHQTCLILTGEGSNGKSTILTLLTKLFGIANVSAVPLHKFDKPFSLFQMYGKMVNIDPDMSEIEKTAEGILKSLISGDRVTWEQKFKPSFTAPPTAKLIFACNTLPRFMDRSQGIWRRLLIIPFEVTISTKERQDDIDDALEAELPGILLWALAGLADLRESGCFAEPEASALAKEELRLESNPARAFLLENYVADPNDWVLRADAYEAYKKFCASNNHRALNENNFGKEVRRTFPTVEQIRPRQGAERPRYYSGLRKKAIDA